MLLQLQLSQALIQLSLYFSLQLASHLLSVTE